MAKAVLPGPHALFKLKKCKKERQKLKKAPNLRIIGIITVSPLIRSTANGAKSDLETNLHKSTLSKICY
jgi:hypothetical protein